MRVAKTFVTKCHSRGRTFKEVKAGSKICQLLEPMPRLHFPFLGNLYYSPDLPSVHSCHTSHLKTPQPLKTALDWTLENVVFLSLTVLLENMK